MEVLSEVMAAKAVGRKNIFEIQVSRLDRLAEYLGYSKHKRRRFKRL